MHIWLFIILFFLILAALTAVNYKINHNFKIETSWLALALAPVIIWLLTTQQLAEFSGFGLAFKLKEATAKTLSLAVDGDAITPEQISPITSDAKEGRGKIDSFIERQLSAVTLQLRRPDYYANRAIANYLEVLTPYDFFKYVLFVDDGGTFAGLVDARKLLFEMRRHNLDVVERIESGRIDDMPGLRRTTVTLKSSKKEALQIMDSKGLAELPVVDNGHRFVGMVERDKITSSIVVRLVSTQND